MLTRLEQLKADLIQLEQDMTEFAGTPYEMYFRTRVNETRMELKEIESK